jgi:AraC-like DNA-binding protein
VHRERIAAAAMRAAQGCDVLLVCLPMGFQEALVVALEHDCKVGAVATVSEAIVWATSTEPALAIVDTMAERDAIGMIQILRRRTQGCVIAAFGTKDLAAEGVAFGLLAADITFTTPMSIPEILDRIRALLLVMENRKTRLSRLSPYVAGAIGLIGDRYGEPLSLKTVANAVGVSPAHLSRLFKQETGKVFKVFVTRVRVELAKRLMRTESTKLKAIARRFGFSDASHLSRHFQKYEGCRPGAYRARVQQG